jgi:hypothetical protein
MPCAASAQKIPVKITPAQVISTCRDEIAVGDSIRFKTVNDTALNKADTIIVGTVDFVSDNGWSCDNAQIDFKTFKTRDTSGKIVTINNPMSINGFEILKYKGNRKAQFFNYIGALLRGKEVEIIPGKDEVIYTIWYEPDSRNPNRSQ